MARILIAFVAGFALAFLRPATAHADDDEPADEPSDPPADEPSEPPADEPSAEPPPPDAGDDDGPDDAAPPAHPDRVPLATEIGPKGKKRLKSPFLEVSFTNSMMFRGAYIGNYTDEIDVIPTNTVLLAGEFMVFPWLRVGAIYNLPTSPERVTINGELHESVVPSTAMVGVTWRPIYFDFARNSRFEVLGLTYFGVVVEDQPRVFPMLGAEFELTPNKERGVAVHAGVFYSVVLDLVSVRYGVAYRF